MKVILWVLLSAVSLSLFSCSTSLEAKCKGLGTVMVYDKDHEPACWTGKDVIYPASEHNLLVGERRGH